MWSVFPWQFTSGTSDSEEPERDLSRSEMTNSCHLPGSSVTWYLNPPFHEHLLASWFLWEDLDEEIRSLIRKMSLG